MKKVIVLITVVGVCLAGSCSLFAQTLSNNTQYVGNDGSLRFFEWYDTQGNRIKTAQEMGVKGTPMLREGWAKGTIRYLNGIIMNTPEINFSLLENKLYYTQDKKLFQILLPIASCDLSFHNEDGEETSYHFKTGFPAIDNQDETGMYEVLYEGENLQLLQWDRKRVKDIYNYGSPREREFTLDQQLYVYLPREKMITALKQALPAIKKILPAYADIIKSYTNSHKLNVHNTNEIIDLMAYLDKHR